MPSLSVHRRGSGRRGAKLEGTKRVIAQSINVDSSFPTCINFPSFGTLQGLAGGAEGLGCYHFCLQGPRTCMLSRLDVIADGSANWFSIDRKALRIFASGKSKIIGGGDVELEILGRDREMKWGSRGGRAWQTSRG